MSTMTRLAAAASVVLMPAAVGVGDQLRMRADTTGTVGTGIDQTTAELAAVHAHSGTYASASWFFYLAALLTIPMTVVLWRLAVRGAPRLAWAGATLGALSAVGQFAHLMGEFATTQALAASADPASAARISSELDGNTLANALIVPYLLGVLLAPAVQAIALRRAGVVPLWAMVAVLAGAAVMVVGGSSPAGSAVWTVLLVAGLVPAAAAAARGVRHSGTGAARTAPVPA